MPGLFTVQLDEAKRRELEALTAGAPKVLPRAMASAVNETARKAKTRVGRGVREVWNLKQDRVKRSVRDSGKATPQDPSTSLVIAKRLIHLSDFGARKTAKGISVAVKKGERKVIPHWFIAKGRNSGKELVLARLRGSDGTRVGRLPVDARYGPSVYEILTNKSPEVLTAALADITADLADRVASKTNYFLEKATAPPEQPAAAGDSA